MKLACAAALFAASGEYSNAVPPYSDGLLATFERYDPKTQTWESLPKPPVYPDHRLVSLAFSDKPVAVFEGTFLVRISVTAPAGAAGR